MAASEQILNFDCFGSRCTVIVAGTVSWTDAVGAAALARHRLLEWHERFSRFLPDSELARLNGNPRATVPAGPMMRRLITAARDAALRTHGLVDASLTNEIERAGYARHFAGDPVPLDQALDAVPGRAPARPRPQAADGWRAVVVDDRAGTVTRPPGMRLDPGGLAKGVFADDLATRLRAFDAVVIDCGGDLRLSGQRAVRRPVTVESPFDGCVLHTYALSSGGVATSGIGRRSWLQDGRPAHHLLDPATGCPAFTGIVQASALAPTATEAEVLSKAALLSGPGAAERWLPHGGVLVFDDGSHAVIEPPHARPAAGAIRFRLGDPPAALAS